MHVTLVNVPEGADVFHSLNRAADEAGYAPAIILSGVGLLSKAVLYVANDDALSEARDIEKTLGIKLDLDGTKYPELDNLPRIRVDEAAQYGITENIDFPELRSPSHWYSRQVFDHPLSVLYARGGRSSTKSSYKYHFAISGCVEREFGRANSFVGQVLPGCIARNPLQFVIGVSANLLTTNVQAWTISIDPGYDVLEILSKFMQVRPEVGDCFVLAADGNLAEAQVANISTDGTEEFYDLHDGGKGYLVEDISGIINHSIGTSRIHATVVLNCQDPPCEALGGRLTRAIVSSEKPLEIFLGEMIEVQKLLV